MSAEPWPEVFLAYLAQRLHPAKAVTWLCSAAEVMQPDVQRLVLAVLALLPAPSDPAYLVRLLKQLMAAVEQRGAVVEEGLAEAFIEATAAQGSAPVDIPPGGGQWLHKTWFYATRPPHQAAGPASPSSQAHMTTSQVELDKVGSPAPQPDQQAASLAASSVLQGPSYQGRAGQGLGELGTSLRAAQGWQGQEQQQQQNHRSPRQQQQGQQQEQQNSVQQHSSPFLPGAEQQQKQKQQQPPSQKQQSPRATEDPPLDVCLDARAGAAIPWAPLAPGLMLQLPPSLWQPVTVRLSSNMLAGSTGCAEWEAGLVLAELLLSCPHLVAGRSCLELGCGSGALATCVTRLCPSHLILTDGDESSITNCMHNLRLNGVPQGAMRKCDARDLSLGPRSPPIQCSLLWWSERLENEVAAISPQVVLGSDLMYNPVVIPELTAALLHFLRPRQAWPPQQPPPGLPASTGPVAYLATTVRQASTLAAFLEYAAARGLVFRDVGREVRAGGAVRFCHSPWLEAAREHVMLHEVTWKDSHGDF